MDSESRIAAIRDVITSYSIHYTKLYEWVDLVAALLMVAVAVAVVLLRYLETKLFGNAIPADATARAARYAIRYLVRPYLEHFRHPDRAADGLVAAYRDWMRQLLSTHSYNFV